MTPGFRVAWNWQLGAAVALAFVLIVYARFLRGRRLGATLLAPVAALVAAFILIWAGSFEVDRYFTNAAARYEDVARAARQMGFSIWWAVYAIGLLAAGFAVRRPALRYMALTIFTITLGKVLLIDMAQVALVYRIGSFLALGALLVAGSFLYQRFFQTVLADWDKGGDGGNDE